MTFEHHLDDYALWRRKLRGALFVFVPRPFGSNPLVVDDLVVATIRGGGQSAIVALERASGRARWRRAIPRLHPGLHFADGVLYGMGEDVFALDPITGRFHWRRPLARDLWWSDSAPVIDSGRFIHCDRAGLVWCLDAASGETRWSRVAPHRTEPIPVNAMPMIADGRVFVTTLSGYAVAYDLETGAELWRVELDGGSADEVRRFEGGVLVNTHTSLFLLDEATGAVRHRWSWDPGFNTCAVAGDLIVMSGGTPGEVQLGAFRGDDLLYRVPAVGRFPALRWSERTGLLYESSELGLGVLDPRNGDRLVQLQTGDRPTSGPSQPAVLDEALYVLGGPGYLYALRHPARMDPPDMHVALAPPLPGRRMRHARLRRTIAADMAAAHQRSLYWAARLLPAEAAPELNRIPTGGLLLGLGEQEALALGHDRLHTAHVLLGILRFGYRPAQHLASFRVELAAARVAARTVVERSPDPLPSVLDPTPDVERLMQRAREVSALLAGEVGGDELLLALTESPGSTAARVLAAVNAPPAALRMVIEAYLLESWLEETVPAFELEALPFISLDSASRELFTTVRAIAREGPSRVLGRDTLVQGLMKLNEEWLHGVLREAGASESDVQERIEGLIAERQSQYPAAVPPARVRTQASASSAIRYAVREARARGQEILRPAHFLLGVVDADGQELAIRSRATLTDGRGDSPPSVIEALGLSLPAVRAALEAYLAP